ncbi:MAG: hypothetical protein LBU83_04630 [Bacteroidales bacterium]|jgi:uracil-DNA glycosylase|nr:hypothetical protein [Bacteroidales bacterium]
MKKEKEICEFCGKIHEGKHCSYYNEGTNKEIAFVFSCPGNAERDSGYPVSGPTGEALELLLKKLKNEPIEKINIGDYRCRYDFRITNATTDIESIEVTRKTEAKNYEVRKEKNIERLSSEIKDFKKIICFGRKAKNVVSIIKLKNVIYVRHLSPRAFTRKKEVKNTPEGRAGYVYDEIKEQLKENQ